MTIARDTGYEVREEPLVRTDLYLADEVFFAGTAAEIVPVCRVDDRAVGDGKPGAVTRAIQDVFSDAVRGRMPQYANWLDYLS
jgi:branched-chain amino acid aminotransferase